MALDQIPAELRELRQWVCAGEDKKPLNPATHELASVLDPSTWGTFEDACLAGTKHVGFVLTDEDPYCIIDLDRPRNEVDSDRQQKILDAFNTYTERSQSGEGYHIVCRGKIPEGARRDKVEIYSSSRYMIFTGIVTKDLPIVGCQAMLDILYSEIKRTTTSALPVDEDETLSDEAIVEMAMRAGNASKFNQLCSGEWSSYPSQSEADLALLSIFAFYSQNNEQVMRLFRMSALGKREKAQKNDIYLNYAIKRIRSNEPRFIDLGRVRAQAEALAMGTAIPQEFPRPISFPKGLVGEVADYILHQATRPVPEIALAGAIAFVAGIVGRAYNISGTGLNQYLLVLAKTGCGKEGAMSGIERLTAAIRKNVPMVDDFIGPAAFASGQALIKTLDTRPTFVSVLGEFGLTLQQLSDPRANSATLMLKKVLLDLYTKSGWESVLRSSVYSDSEKNTKIVQAPSVTILGESTPEAFYDGISTSHIAEGLVPRFLVIEYLGDRPPRNASGPLAPPDDLVQALTKLVTQALTMSANRTCCEVPIDPHAQAILDELDQEADRRINAHQSNVEAQLWNRAHLKALKLAALIAVGMDPLAPMVTAECARWAVRMVTADVKGMVGHYASGDVGMGDAKQMFELRRLITKYLISPIDQLKDVGSTYALHRAKIVPLVYLQRRGYNLAAFNKDRLGAGTSIKKTLEALVDSGQLVEVPAAQSKEKFGGIGRCFALGDGWEYQYSR